MPKDYDRQLRANEFSQIIKVHNDALERIQRFREAYPYLMAPNVFETLEHNVKENVQIMYRELQNIHRKEGPHYEKKYVCKRCHRVFMTSLQDGLCDECRAQLGKE